MQADLEANRQPSILELGCANGPMLRFLKEGIDTSLIRYTGIDMWPVYRDDFHKNFGEKGFILGDVETFLVLQLSDLGGERFSMFVASVTLCMINPERTRRAIHKAAELTQSIVIHDSILNLSGNISQERAIIGYSTGTEFWQDRTYKTFAEIRLPLADDGKTIDKFLVGVSDLTERMPKITRSYQNGRVGGQ